MNDPIPSAVQEVVDLYASEFASLRFGDLEPAVLDGACDEVKASAAEVARAEALLENARAALTEKQEALLQKAQRALAYARVYAESRPELASRVERIALPRAPRRIARSDSPLSDPEPSLVLETTTARPRHRGRPRRELSAMLDENVDPTADAATS